MRRLFLDVGAHHGETARVVLAYPDTQVVCFEPAASAQPFLAALQAEFPDRVVIQPFGLWDRTASVPLYSPGTTGASIFADKHPQVPGVETVEMVRASEWVAAHVPADAKAILKLNCEGAECDILAEVLDAGLLAPPRFSVVLVDYDARKAPSQRRKIPTIQARLAAIAGLRTITPPLGFARREGRACHAAWIAEALA